MSTEPSIGDVLLDRYELVEEIGRGGFGVVFRAKQLGMNRDVAIKLLHEVGDDEMRERFRREAMMARNLNHPHTIRQYDFGETDDGMMYLVLEFLDGVDLVQAIRRDGALGDDRVRHIAEGVLKSLGEAHAQGIVHRDLKPANIMICNVFGESDFPKVLDFGIAKTVHGNTDLTQAGVALGSPRYMAPEILQGLQPTPAADVYSVAITLAEAIIGKPLLDVGNSVEAAQLQLSPRPLPVPDELKGSSLYPWLSIALKKDPSQRYGDAAEMLDHLHAPADVLARRGADGALAAISATDDDAVPTGRYNPAPDIDPHGDTMAGRLEDTNAASMETLPQDGLDTSGIAADADQFAKTEALHAISGPDSAGADTAGPTDATAEGIAIGGYDDGEAPTEMISLDEFEQHMATAATAEANPALTPTAEANPALGQQVASPQAAGDAPTERHAAVDPNAMQANVGASGQRPAAGFQSVPPGGLGPVPGIGAAADEDRTEFVDLNDMPPTVTASEKKTQKKLFLALGAIVVLGILAIIGLGVFLVWLRSEQPKPSPANNTPPAVASTDTSEKVEVRIYAKPKVSSVVIDGQEKTKTPARFRMNVSDLPKTIELRHNGYKPATIEVTKDGKNVFDVKLESAVKMNDDKPSGTKPEAGSANSKETAEKEEPASTKTPPRKPRKKRKPKKKDDNPVDIW